MADTLLTASGLKKYFPVKRGLLEKPRFVKAVDDVDLTVHVGETVGLVGESGCGKSTLGRLLLHLERVTEGQITYRGQQIEKMSNKEMRPLRKEMQLIFQDPYASLNPRMTIYESVKAPLDTFFQLSEEEKRKQVESLLDYVGIGQQHMAKYPHELSGGQRQRVVIARAMISRPDFVVCDEPVSALDVSVRSQVLNLMKKLQKDRGLSYLFISHDLSVVRFLCDTIVVMYLGKVVECATKEELFANSIHPYTKALLSAIPIPDIHVKSNRIILHGDVPSPVDPPAGCRFHTRCPYATDLCRQKAPEMFSASPTHKVLCHFAERLAK